MHGCVVQQVDRSTSVYVKTKALTERLIDAGTGEAAGKLLLFKHVDVAIFPAIAGETVTTISDVYSLGVILYELLIGRSPYPDADSRKTVEKLICDHEPEKPSAAWKSKTNPETTKSLGDQVRDGAR